MEFWFLLMLIIVWSKSTDNQLPIQYYFTLICHAMLGYYLIYVHVRIKLRYLHNLKSIINVNSNIYTCKE